MDQDQIRSKVAALRTIVVTQMQGVSSDPVGLTMEYYSGTHLKTTHPTPNLKFILDTASHVHICNDFAAFRQLENSDTPISWMKRNNTIQADIGIVAITTTNHMALTTGDVHMFLTCRYVKDSDYNVLSQPKLVKDYNMHVEYSFDMRYCYVGNHQATLKFCLQNDDFYHLETTILPSIPFEPAPQFVRNFN
jgi:hypothetical protein